MFYKSVNVNGIRKYFYWKESNAQDHAMRMLWRKQELDQEPEASVGERKRNCSSQSAEHLTFDLRAGQRPHRHPHAQHRGGKDH